MCGRICANVQSLVKKQPILVQNETLSKRKRPKFFIALSDFFYKVSFVLYGFSKIVFVDY